MNIFFEPQEDAPKLDTDSLYNKIIVESILEKWNASDELKADRTQRLNFLSLKLNGGKNSGNHNPGQGRGIGKPGGSYSSETPMKSMTYSERGKNGPQLIRETLSYLRKKHPEIYNEDVIEYAGRGYWNKEGGFKIDKEKLLSGEITFWNEPYKEGNRYLYDLTELFSEHFYQDSKGNDRDKNGESLRGFGSKLLYGILSYTLYGAKSYGKETGGRKEFDKRFGISDFIDKNDDVHYTSDKPLYRGLTTKISRAKAIKIGEKVDMGGASSWTEDEKIAKRFLDSSLIQKGTVKVLFKDVTKGKRNAMINPFSSDSATGEKHNQSEVMYSGSANFTIKNVNVKVEEFYEDFNKIERKVYYVDVESK